MWDRSSDDNMSKPKAMITKLMEENPVMRRTRSTSCTGSETADGSKSKPASSKPDEGCKAVGEHDIKSEKAYTVEDESTLVFKYAPKDILQQSPVTHDIVLVENGILCMLKIGIPYAI